MTVMANHARKNGTPWAAWAVLIGMGGTSVTYNVYHAVHHSHMNPFLALLYGLAPVAAAALLSHIVAELDGGWFMKTVTFLVMLGAMALSIGATASVVRPAAGSWMQYLFGAVLDAAALVALQRILSGHRRKAEEVSALAVAEQAVREAAGKAERATAERARIEAEAAEERAALKAELARVNIDLTAANATVDALRSARVPGRKRSRTTARKPAGTSARNRPGTTAPEPALTTGPELAAVPAGSTGPESELDIDQEARLLILDYVAKGHSASEAGRLAGKTDGYGRQVVRLDRAAKKEPAGSERAEGDMS